MGMSKAAYEKPWHVRLKGVEGGKAFVAGFNNQPLAVSDAAARTKRGEAFKCKPVYEAVKKES